MRQIANILQENCQYNSSISLDNFHISVVLGVTEEERSVKQTISVSLKIFFSKLPKACFSDNIQDTVCYANLTDIMEKYCCGKEFHLLEYLCLELYKQVKDSLNIQAGVWIKVEKSPPIYNLQGSTSFEYSDL